MAQVRFNPIPTAFAQSIWKGGLDANSMKAEHHISDGNGVPCRHCLCQVAAGDAYLILAYRPFPAPQPYAEIGPIFLHAEPCLAYEDRENTPAMFLGGEPRIVRGYDGEDRIVYDTGRIVRPEEIVSYARDLLSNPEIAYIHVRSSMNNCFSFRIDRGPASSKGTPIHSRTGKTNARGA